jgi:hypothetical protein
VVVLVVVVVVAVVARSAKPFSAAVPSETSALLALVRITAPESLRIRMTFQRKYHRFPLGLTT